MTWGDDSRNPENIKPGTEVQILVSACTRRCCGGDWARRKGEAIYVGKIIWAGKTGVVLQSAQLGRIAEVAVIAEEILDLSFVD